ncbi:MAG: peptidoglycan editing factor PgeF [Desulfuromonadales bacterium]
MITVKHGKFHYLQPAWAGQSNLASGFTMRNGGSSRPPFNSLNLGFGSGDQPSQVEANRAVVTRAFDLEPYLFLTVNQVHGSEILVIDQPNPDVSHFQRVDSDAIITNQRNILIGILIADCFPVILYDQKKHVAGVVHLGWRGTAAGLLGRTVKAMCEIFACQTVDLCAAVGPGIAAHSYEVDRPVRDAFRQGTDRWGRIATEVSLGHWQLDLQQSILLQLDEAGVDRTRVDIVQECTCCHKEVFFSYRRDTGRTGRQMGFALLR